VVNKAFVRFILLIIEVSVVVLGLVGINFYILPHNAYVSAYDWFFFEGIFCIIIGILFAFGRGGIGPGSLREARARAAADAIYGTDYAISEVFRRDKWKAKGFPNAALVLLVAGVVVLLIYFLNF
jgi:hypothetical protein